MNILAVDPGIANTGVAFCINGTVGFKTIVTSKKDSLSVRIRDILFSIEAMTKQVYDLLVIEDFVGHLGKHTVLLVGALIGLHEYNDFRLVHPRKWVKEMFGRKKDYKIAAKKWCQKHGFKPETQHEADALCLLEWGKKICS